MTATPITVTIGVTATCSDGVCGTVIRAVIDPVAHSMTHVIVEPTHRSGLGRLVPVALIEPAGEGVRLHCTLADFGKLDHAEETQFLPGTSGGYSGFGPGEALNWPYYGKGGMGTYAGTGSGLAMGSVIPPVIVNEFLPAGEIAIHRNQPVHATDGEIGKVHGLVLDPSNHHVTHVLLQEGHVWGHRQVAIPIKNVTDLTDGIALNLTKDEVRDLPPVDVAAHNL